jgi:hypothetical protein
MLSYELAREDMRDVEAGPIARAAVVSGGQPRASAS